MAHLLQVHQNKSAKFQDQVLVLNTSQSTVTEACQSYPFSIPYAMSMVAGFVQLMNSASIQQMKYHLERQDSWPLPSAQPTQWGICEVKFFEFC